MRIVIVEDEVKIREGMGKMIRSFTGHLIVGEAADGEEGLDMIRRFNPDLIITDIRMPKVDGLEMVRRLKQEKNSAHIVILSGYSEFDYAKKAIHYGVDDYLLKPLSVEDVQEMLGRIQELLFKEREMKQDLGETRLQSLLLGSLEDTPENLKKLREACQFEEDMKYCMMVGYIGCAGGEYRNLVEEKTGELKEKFSDLKIFLVYQEDCQIYVCLVGGLETRRLQEMEQAFYHRLLFHYQGTSTGPVWARTSVTLENLGRAFQTLKGWLSYRLVLEETGWLTREVIEAWKPEPFVYPAELGNRLKNAVCQENTDKIKGESQAFLEYMRKKPYEPEEVRRAFIRIYQLALDTLWDLDRNLYEHLKNTSVLHQMENAVTWKEMEMAFADMTEAMTGPKVKREDISNFVIKKAINYIRENYQEGITQEEVSRKLDITPEYLSTLFNREMGINFSTFLKQFRISHAKRLLKGTEMKIYEVAQAVGYNDAKYFARVFKEEQGLSPADYRKLN